MLVCHDPKYHTFLSCWCQNLKKTNFAELIFTHVVIFCRDASYLNSGETTSRTLEIVCTRSCSSHSLYWKNFRHRRYMYFKTNIENSHFSEPSLTELLGYSIFLQILKNFVYFFLRHSYKLTRINRTPLFRTKFRVPLEKNPDQPNFSFFGKRERGETIKQTGHFCNKKI